MDTVLILMIITLLQPYVLEKSKIQKLSYYGILFEVKIALILEKLKCDLKVPATRCQSQNKK